uniref:Protocadherin alpha-7-like n=1 Tax=Camelus bactrianus TaxID=9837 RepID=A0A9W3FNZ2_CAMBA|nr:protocadherin alpha-7-like [Camelus bactrianus]
MEFSWGSGQESRGLLLSLLFLAAWKAGSGQVRYSIPEEAKHGTFVGRIAQDLGLEVVELVPRLFQVASRGREDLLEVNLQNGILFVNSRIDREELCGRNAECSIHLEVIVDRPLQVFHVEVDVKDINDNPPVFPGTQKNLFMAESRPLDSRFPLEGASDADIGANALLTHTLSPNEYFSLENPSNDKRVKRLGLVLRKPLDREEAPEIFLVLTATDGGKPELTGTVQLLVKVLDANDNAPAFDKTLYTVKLPENVPNGTLVIKLNASDLDEGSNGDIIYSFSTDILPNVKSKFYIDGITGEIMVKEYIDFEESKSYEILVEGIDKGQPPLSGHCTVMVEIEDTNDNVPVMEFKSLSLPIREDAPLGTVIALISVSDLDSSINGQVSCTLSPHVPFKLVSTFKNYYSLVLDRTLDRESMANYVMVVIAQDRGSPSLSATASVSVDVADVNDNAPTFAQPEYTVFVKENTPPGCHIFTVSARDADAQENALVSYSLVERRVGERALSSYVSVHAESGKVYALQPGQVPKVSSRASAGLAGTETELVDVNVYLIIAICAVSSLFVLTLLLYTALRCSAPPREGACGPGKPRLVCSSAVGSWSSLQQRQQRVCFGEGLPKTDLMAFSPSQPQDPISTDTLSVRVLQVYQNSGEGRIGLTDLGFILMPRQDLLMEISQQVFEMVITPEDRLGSRCLLLLVLLLPAWDAGSGQIHYSVPEEVKHGTFVGRIAQDLGLELAELVPRLFRGASKGRGGLLEGNLQNGILFVNSRIDREELCGRSAECSIHLEVIVDRPLQVFHVEVEVKDINDNPPVFPVKDRRISIYESRLPDSLFPLEGATDADIGSNSILTYKLSSNEYFALDVKTNSDDSTQIGLVLRKSLDREKAPEHNLFLMATDEGKPELTGTVQLLVIVLDVNDNAPSFGQSEYEVKIFENSDNGTIVIRLNASDRDEGVNGEVSYSFNSLVPPIVSDQFRIDPQTGEIVIKGNIDFEKVNLYKIRIDATDKGHPPLAGHCTVSVKILDENDNVPQIALTSLSLPVREDAQFGTVIALLTVSDLDSDANGRVTCFLTPDVPFKLVSTFKNYYSLVLDSALDRESVANYELVVTARDGGSPSLSATVSVSVDVSDVNDNAPTFAQPEYTVFVKENNPPGCHIFTVSARDADAQENALVSYSLVERRVGERALSSYVSVHAESGKVYALQPPFRVGLYTGEISTTRALDEADAPRQRLLVLVKDHGEPALTATATVLLSLEDSGQAPKASSRASAGVAGTGTALVDVNVYLIIAICAVSSLFVLTLLLYTALRCSAPPREGACGPGKPRLVCSSAVGSWSYSQQRRQRVCSGEGPPKADLMAFSPSLPPCPVVADMSEPQDLNDHCSKSFESYQKCEAIGIEGVSQEDGCQDYPVKDKWSCDKMTVTSYCNNSG